MQDKPYRVVVWGPGTLGGVLLREILPKSELDLVGVLAYSKEKDGVDVGTYLGLPPVGVTMTTDKERIFGLGADVALLAPHIMAQVDLHADLTDDICRLLESGTNVISASGYFYPPHHGPELVERLEAACRAGGTVLHSTGINPGLLNERWTTTLTSVFTRIDRIVVQEIFDCSALPSADMVQAIGFGRDPSESHAVIELGERYYGESLANTCRILGHQMVRLDMDREFVIADADYQIGALTVAKGTIGGLIHRFTAVVDGRPFYTLEEIWYVDRAICPIEVTAGDYWTIAIEGWPTCLRATIELVGSLDDNRRLRDAGAELPGYYGTGVPMLQAIPVVCAAEPGVLYPWTFTHYVPDLRMLDSPTHFALERPGGPPAPRGRPS